MESRGRQPRSSEFNRAHNSMCIDPGPAGIPVLAKSTRSGDMPRRLAKTVYPKPYCLIRKIGLIIKQNNVLIWCLTLSEP